MRTTTVSLPNGFKDFTDSAVKQVELRKLDGNDEDMMLDKDELQQSGILDRLLQRCIVSMGSAKTPEAVKELYESRLLLADTFHLLVELRKWSIGPIYRFDHNCPRCGRITRHKIDLTTLAVDKQKDEDFGKERYVDKLEDGTPFQFRLLKASDSAMLETIRLQYKKERATRELLLQVKDFAGEAPTVESLKALTWADRNAMRQIIDTHQGGTDAELVMRCQFDDHVYKDNMPIAVKDFFFPAGDLSEPRTAIPFRAYGTTAPSSQPDSSSSAPK